MQFNATSLFIYRSPLGITFFKKSNQKALVFLIIPNAMNGTIKTIINNKKEKHRTTPTTVNNIDNP